MPKVRPGYETIILAPTVEVNGVPKIITPTGLVDFYTPTAAALNIYQAISKPSQTNASAGGNISCAITDDLTLGLTGSEIDNSKTICSKGTSGTPTLYNFDAKLNAKRDKDLAGDGQWNLFRDLTRAPGAQYAIIHRVRGEKDSTETFAIGDEIDMYYVETDNPVPDFSDGKPILQKVEFIPKGLVNVKYTIAS